jgi:hypothetical protein
MSRFEQAGTLPTPNNMFDRTAGSHALAAAGQHERSATSEDE